LIVEKIAIQEALGALGQQLADDISVRKMPVRSFSTESTPPMTAPAAAVL
jgi:hypothetical protein